MTPHISGKSNGESRYNPPGLAWAFTTFHAANWHPLTWILHDQFFGIGASHLLMNTLRSRHVTRFLVLLREHMPLAQRAVAPSLHHPLRGIGGMGVEQKISCPHFSDCCTLTLTLCEAPSGSRYLWTAIARAGLIGQTDAWVTPSIMLLIDYQPLRRFAPYWRAITRQPQNCGHYCEEIAVIRSRVGVGRHDFDKRNRVEGLSHTRPRPITLRLSTRLCRM
jgi:hypothetical protein